MRERKEQRRDSGPQREENGGTENPIPPPGPTDRQT